MGWRLAFAGAPTFAATILQSLIESRHRVELVYSQPDRRAGRGRKLVASPVRTLAEASGIAVRTPTRLAGEERALSPFDFFVVAAYGLLLPPAILDAPRRRLLERPCFAAAALARCRTRGTNHHGRRWRNRREHHAHGRRLGHGAGVHAPKHDAGRGGDGRSDHRRSGPPRRTSAARHPRRSARPRSDPPRRPTGHLCAEAERRRLAHRLAALRAGHKPPGARSFRTQRRRMPPSAMRGCAFSMPCRDTTRRFAGQAC